MATWKSLGGNNASPGENAVGASDAQVFPCPFQGHELNHRDRKEWAENGGKQNAGGERETKISLQNKPKG